VPFERRPPFPFLLWGTTVVEISVCIATRAEKYSQKKTHLLVFCSAELCYWKGYTRKKSTYHYLQNKTPEPIFLILKGQPLYVNEKVAFFFCFFFLSERSAKQFSLFCYRTSGLLAFWFGDRRFQSYPEEKKINWK
jgi:hypothetical protein